MCLPPKPCKIKSRARRVISLAQSRKISRPVRRWKNEETGLVRQFYPAPTRGRWKLLTVRYADRG